MGRSAEFPYGCATSSRRKVIKLPASKTLALLASLLQLRETYPRSNSRKWMYNKCTKPQQNRNLETSRPARITTRIMLPLQHCLEELKISSFTKNGRTWLSKAKWNNKIETYTINYKANLTSHQLPPNIVIVTFAVTLSRDTKFHRETNVRASPASSTIRRRGIVKHDSYIIRQRDIRKSRAIICRMKPMKRSVYRANLGRG